MSMEALIQRFTGSFLDRNHHTYPDLPFNLVDGDAIHASPSPPTSVVSSEGDAGEEGDFSDATLKLISQMLMEDGLENKPCMYQDCLALQATEKSFYDVLGKQYPPHLSSDDNSPRTCSSDSSNSSVSVNDFIDQSSWIREKFKPSYYDEYTFESIMQSISSPNGSGDGSVDSLPFQISSEAKFGELVPTTDYVNYRSESTWKVLEGAEQNQGDHPPHGSREKKTHNREDADYTDGAGRSNKQLASFAEEADDQLYDKVLLCPRLNPHLHQDEPLHFLCTEHDDDDASSIVAGRKSPQNGVAAKGANGGGRGRGKKQGNKKEVIDLRTLLSQCAQAVANADIRNANELLNRIRQHASPTGDGTERLAYYFANALEARLAGTGTSLYAAFKTKRISVADILKGYQVFMKACPFNKMSNMFANKSIAALVHDKTDASL
ncbi:scarecrow-like protein 14 [Camellia sinensis]|uniref:scarecrow-like protein 14 n=1 Tax=Camellia sinensis TaxID=4442 RepID=UPI0010362FA0|nr:scarecrow-like protein 14 [Camellia sinensis]